MRGLTRGLVLEVRNLLLALLEVIELLLARRRAPARSKSCATSKSHATSNFHANPQFSPIPVYNPILPKSPRKALEAFSLFWLPMPCSK